LKKKNKPIRKERFDKNQPIMTKFSGGVNLHEGSGGNIEKKRLPPHHVIRGEQQEKNSTSTKLSLGGGSWEAVKGFLMPGELDNSFILPKKRGEKLQLS